MRSDYRKNTSTKPEEVVGPEPTTKELMEQVKKQMQKVELLKKATDFGIREGLGAMPLVEIHLIKVSIGKMTREGTMEKDEQVKVDEGMSTSTQLTPNKIATSTQPPPTTTIQAPIFTSSTTTIHVTVFMSTSTDTFSMTSITSPPLIQKIAPIMTPTTERVTIHNIESDSD